MDPIMELADNKNIVVVEDCAEAHGAEYKGKKVGSIGIGCFSFFGNKIITTGEGGMVTTNDKELYDYMKYMRGHARKSEGSKHYFHPDIGFNYRMTDLQGAIGVAQLGRIDEFITRRDKIAELYSENLKDVKGIKLLKAADYARPVCWVYSLLVQDDFPVSRDELMKILSDKKIENRPFFHPIHLQPPYKPVPCPNSELVAKQGISLPTFYSLTDEQIKTVCDAIKEASK